MSAKENKRAVEHGLSGSKLQGPEVSGHNLQRAWRYYMRIDCEDAKLCPMANGRRRITRIRM